MCPFSVLLVRYVPFKRGGLWFVLLCLFIPTCATALLHPTPLPLTRAVPDGLEAGVAHTLSLFGVNYATSIVMFAELTDIGVSGNQDESAELTITGMCRHGVRVCACACARARLYVLLPGVLSSVLHH